MSFCTRKWNSPTLLLSAFLMVAASAPAQTNADFSSQIVDGLGHPVPGVAVEIYRLHKQTNSPEEKIVLARAMSGTDGNVQAIFDQNSVPTNDSVFVALSKTNYSGYFAEQQPQYTLRRRFREDDVARIAKMPAADQEKDLRELLAGDMDSPKGISELVFVKESKLRSSLKRLLNDSMVGAQAGGLLAFIGMPDDFGIVVQYAPSPNGDPSVNHLAYDVASALLEPSSERQWSFLEKCAANDYNDRWVDLAAIRTLKLIASPRSLKELQKVLTLNPARANEIDAAVAYVNSHPAPLSDPNLVAAATKVSDTLAFGLSMGNEPPRYNEERDMALIDCNFLVNGTQFLVYTATFQKTTNVWKLRGLRQTRETVLPKAPAAPKAQAVK